MNPKMRVRVLVASALQAALVCVATMLIKIPSPLKGYINLGDAAVLVVGRLLPAQYAFLAAGAGSALADLLSGYVVYAPVTFLIKGAMALTVSFCYHRRSAKSFGFRQTVGDVSAETLMVLGYYLFEGFLYGFGPSLANVPANAVQGVAGVIVGRLLMRALQKAYFSRYKKNEKK